MNCSAPDFDHHEKDTLHRSLDGPTQQSESWLTQLQSQVGSCGSKEFWPSKSVPDSAVVHTDVNPVYPNHCDLAFPLSFDCLIVRPRIRTIRQYRASDQKWASTVTVSLYSRREHLQ